MQSRPMGITILAVLSAIGGVFGIIGGLGVFALFSALGGAGLGAILGLFLLATSAASLFLAYGFWTLKPWAWALGIGLEGLSIALTVLQLITGNGAIGGSVVSIAIAGVIIYYLNTPTVKSAFGRP